MSSKGGNRPLHICGTRFVSHKVAALERLIERFGAYLAHLITMTEDSSMQPADRQKMKGYILKWQNSQILLGCTLFHDILKSPLKMGLSAIRLKKILPHHIIAARCHKAYCAMKLWLEYGYNLILSLLLSLLGYKDFNKYVYLKRFSTDQSIKTDTE